MDNSDSQGITAIIPVYNTKDYLRQCIDSVIRQNDVITKVIIVDDGSRDGSGDICDEYARRYSSVQVIHVSNGGAGAARNIGIDLACSEWVVFIDSDDYLDINYSKAISRYLEGLADIILYDGTTIFTDDRTNKPWQRYYPNRNREYCSGLQYFSECVRCNKFNASPCLAVYRKSLLIDLEFPEGIIYEDEFFSLVALLRAKRITQLTEALYYRRVRANSVMTSKYEKKRLHDWCQIASRIETYFNDNTGKYNDYKNEICMHVFRNCELAHFYYEEAIKEKVLLESEETVFFENTIKSGIEYVLSCFGCIENMTLDICVRMLRLILYHKRLTKTDFEIELYKELDKRLYDVYLKVLSRIGFDDSKKKYAIYGIGKHTDGLLDKYRQYFGKVKSELFFCVSTPKESEKYAGKDVIPIQAIPDDVDGVIISSFVYYDEMEDAVRSTGKDVPIISLYDEYQVDLFSWVH